MPHFSPLDAVLRPRSVAVVGASNRPGSVGGEIFHNLICSSLTGAVYPVNRASTVVQSVRAYPSLAEVPDPVALVTVAVPRDSLPHVVADSFATGAPVMVLVPARCPETPPPPAPPPPPPPAPAAAPSRRPPAGRGPASRGPGRDLHAAPAPPAPTSRTGPAASRRPDGARGSPGRTQRDPCPPSAREFAG